MSNYTITLREYIESLSHDGVQRTTKEMIENARAKLFDFNYPIFDEAYRNVFETHFIRFFYVREIGQETFGLFKFHLETWLNINMPYWNKMFSSELIQYDPLTNTKTSVENTKTKNVTRNETTTADNFDRQLQSDNPDTRLALTATDGEGVIEYANKIYENNENNKVIGSSTGDEVETFIYSKTGKIGVQSFSKMLVDYRKSLLRVEKQLFDEMQQLFMLVY